MSLSHALLGLLTVQPRSGYELTKAFKTGLGHYAWQAGHTAIYPELNRLAEQGLIEVTHEGARGSRTYDVTTSGREELRHWLLTPPQEGAKVRNEPILRMFLLSALDPEDALIVLRRIAEQAGAEAAALRQVRSDDGSPVPRGPAGFGQLAAELGRRHYQTVHEWALWAIERLEGSAQPQNR